MTAQEYMDEVKLRMNRIKIETSVSDPLILTYINKSRRELQRYTVSYFPERYADILNISLTPQYYEPGYVDEGYSTMPVKVVQAELPDDIIEVYNVFLCWISNNDDIYPGVQYRTEARRLTKWETENISFHAWNNPMRWSPAYNLERMFNTPTTSGKWVINILGLERDANISLFDLAGSVWLEVWCTRVIPEIESYNSAGQDEAEAVVLPEIEELVIYNTMLYCLENAEEAAEVQMTMQQIKDSINLIQKNFDIYEQKQVQLLPTKEGN